MNRATGPNASVCRIFVLSHGDLSMLRSGAAMSQGQFRRDRGRLEEDGGWPPIAGPTVIQARSGGVWLDPGGYMRGKVKHFDAHLVCDDGFCWGPGGDSSRLGLLRASHRRARLFHGAPDERQRPRRSPPRLPAPPGWAPSGATGNSASLAATSILEPICAQHLRAEGRRDEETELRPNKETARKIRKGRL